MFTIYKKKIKQRILTLSPKTIYWAKRIINYWLGGYPRVMANEIGAVAAVLRGSQWNMAYGKGLVHERLEAAFAEYIGVAHSVAVNTGGMALQMSMRGLGLKPANEVVLQIDTCSATAFAVMNAGCTPLFSDISKHSFMLPIDQLDELVGKDTKAIIATHMWGNPERAMELKKFCESRKLFLIEDACLALGARSHQGLVGAIGNVGVFSFGCLKPIQGGEGGMIVTDDEALARELRSMRHWGDRTIEYGIRDTTQLAWNGRMSELVAAVVNEQLKGYPSHLSSLQNAVMEFNSYLNKFDGLELVLGDARNFKDCAFTQIVLRVDEEILGCSKSWLMESLGSRGVTTWHANFELINSLSFFKNDRWRDWLINCDDRRIGNNYNRDYPVARQVFDAGGLGIPKNNFISRARLKYLIRQIDAVMARR